MIGTETVEVESIAHAVAAALEADQLDLPALPDMAVKIRDALANADASLEKAVHLVSCDPVVAVHVMKAANSSGFHGAVQVNTLRGAISRIGYRMLYGIVMNIVLTKLFRARRKLVDGRLRAIWQQSREVAADCFVLAEREGLHPDFALLAGLVHKIGALPLCVYVDRLPAELDAGILDELLRNHAQLLSTAVLQRWNFPAEVVAILSGHLNPASIAHPEIADYIDILDLAIRLGANGDPDSSRNLVAAERLGFYPGDCRKFLSMHEAEIIEMKGLLGIRGGKARPYSRGIEAAMATAPAALPASTEPRLLDSLSALFRRRLPPGH